jgi:hypothetical protein
MQTHTFGGREFKVLSSSTCRRDIELGNLLASSGVKEAIAEHILDDTAMTAAIADRLTRSTRLFEMMGCCLIPVDVDPMKWTLELKRQTMEFFEQLPGEELRAVLVAGVALVRAFFMVELLSTATSLKYSMARESEQLDHASAATTSMASGA